MKKHSFFSTRLTLFTAVCAVSVLTASCSLDDNDDPKDPAGGIAPPIELACDFFKQNQTLVDNPEAPVDYIVSCNSSVEGKLTIESGVVVKFTKDAGLIFRETTSSIRAVGTSDKPIILTGTESNPGWWKGLSIQSGDDTNLMEYVTVSYAGSGNEVANIEIAHNSSFTLKNSIISHGKDAGLRAVRGGVNLTLEKNTFTKNAFPMEINYIYAHKASPTDDYSGNELDRVLLHSYTETIMESVSWKKINVPYRTAPTNVSSISINETGILTIEPGVELEMSPGTMIKLEEKGGLKIVGTAAEPIIIRGEYSGPGSWHGFNLSGTHPINEIAFTKISDAGEDPGSHRAAINLWYNTKLYVHDTEFKDMASCGVFIRVLHGQDTNPNYSSSNLSYVNTSCKELFEK